MRDIEILAEGDIIFDLEGKANVLTTENIKEVNPRMGLLKLRPADLEDKEKVAEKIEQAIEGFSEGVGTNILEANDEIKKSPLKSFIKRAKESDVEKAYEMLESMASDIDTVIDKAQTSIEKVGKAISPVSNKDIKNAKKAFESDFTPEELKEFTKTNNAQVVLTSSPPHDWKLRSSGTDNFQVTDRITGNATLILPTESTNEAARGKANDFAFFTAKYASLQFIDRGGKFERLSKDHREFKDKKNDYPILNSGGAALLPEVRMGYVNDLLNGGTYRQNKVEKDFPETVKVFDKMLSGLDQLTQGIQEQNEKSREELQSRTRTIKSNSVSDQDLVVPSNEVEDTSPQNNENQPSPNEYPDPTPVDSVVIDQEPTKPEKFTADQASKTVKDLLEDVDPFLKEMLAETPPKNRFKVDLALEENHPVTLTLADKNNEASSKVYRTDIKDLDDAVEAKKQLQTIILGRDDILPYRNIAEDRTVTLGSSEMIPEGKPNSAEVTPESGFYKLRLEYLEGDTRIGVTIPLGVSQQDENKQERAEERADEAIRFVETQQRIGFSITKGDTELYLKGRVNEGKFEGEWKNPERMLVEGFDNKTKVDFSDREVDGQETEIAKVSISSKPKLNPTWTADVTILVDGDRVKSFAPDLNTSDHMVAQQRAAEYVNELASRLEAAQGDNPRGWALDEQGELLKTDAEAGLGSLSVEGIKKLEEQIQRSKVDFSVEPVKDPEEIGDKTRVTIGVFRGARANAQEQFVNEKTGKMVEKTFVAPDEDTAIDFAVAVDDTFKHYLQEAYSTKTESSTGEELTKTGKRYHPMTSVNLFEDAIRTNLDKFDNVEKSHVEAKSAEGNAQSARR